MIVDLPAYLEEGYVNEYIGVTDTISSTCSLFSLSNGNSVIYYRHWNDTLIKTDCNGDCWFKLKAKNKNKKLSKVYADILKLRFKQGLERSKKKKNNKRKSKTTRVVSG